MIRYESMYILKPHLEEEERNALIAKFNDIIVKNGGEVEQANEWGMKKLAYPIDYIEEGYYVLLTFSAPPTLPVELERNYKINDNVMRFMVVKPDEVKEAK